MPKAKQLVVRVSDRPGMLGEVASALGEKRVNIQAFLACRGEGAFRFVVDKPVAAKKVFAEHGWDASEEEIIVVTLPDRPGSLGSVASKLGEAAINIHYAYTGPTRVARKANTYLGVADVQEALKALR